MEQKKNKQQNMCFTVYNTDKYENIFIQITHHSFSFFYSKTRQYSIVICNSNLKQKDRINVE